MVEVVPAAATLNTNPNPNPKNTSLCEECGVIEWKYKCPGCSIRSCSLPCVKTHKTRTSCTGKRPRTQFTPISQFDDNLLLSDYNLLEEAKRVAETAKRRRGDHHYHFKLPFKLRALKDAASRRKTDLLLLPSGMSKRKKNQSQVDIRTNTISWTIEWRFHSTNVVLTDNRVNERMTLFSVIGEHLKPGPWSTQLKPFIEQLDDLRFFILKNAKDAKSPFRELDTKAPMRHNLANLLIVEYPIIHIFLPTTTPDINIIKDLEPFSEKPKLENPINDIPSPKGVLFKEEEPEDNESDPHILDLLYTNPEAPKLEFNDANGQGSSKENEFGFEQDLRDVFSGFIGDSNPDEYLDFDGFVDEELEEGEIR